MIKNKQGDVMNRNGNFVPLKSVDKHLIARDKVVTKLISRIKKLQSKIESEKKLIDSEVNKFLRRYTNGKSIEGNVQLSDFANLNIIRYSSNNIIQFDERLNAAKVLIDKCLRKWSKDSNVQLRSIISEAFNVDKKGQVNTALILKLTKIQIEDKDWKEAVDLIHQSIDINGTRNYLSFRSRKNKDEDFKPINLNFKDL